MAVFLAIRAGLQNACAGRPAYGWTLTTDPSQRRVLIRTGLSVLIQIKPVLRPAAFFSEIQREREREFCV